MALAVAEESKIKEELSRLKLGVGLEYWQEVLLTETGKVLVDTLAELEDFRVLILTLKDYQFSGKTYNLPSLFP